MKIKEIWKNFRWGIWNYLVVTNTYGYFGDCHIAVNYTFIHSYLMPYLRDIIPFQASRRGIKINDISPLKSEARSIQNGRDI